MMKILAVLTHLILAALVHATPPQSTLPEPPQSTLPKNFACPVFPQGCRCGCEVTGICTCHGLAWHDKSYAEAVATGKPVVIYFTTDPCPPCITLEETVFTDLEVKEAAKDWVWIRGDEATAALFGVDRFPTTVMVHRGRQWRSVGLVHPFKLASQLRFR